MLEWYPHVLVVSTLIPRGVDRTTNVVEFYYPEEIALFEREFVEAEQAAYMETAAEDDEIAERMDAGRRALYAAGRSEVGPYQSPMEDGMQHFHEFLRRELDADISDVEGCVAGSDPPASPPARTAHASLRYRRHAIPATTVFCRCVCPRAERHGAPAAGASRLPTIPYEKYRLANGLEVILRRIARCRSSRSISGTTSAPPTRSRDAPASRTCSST